MRRQVSSLLALVSLATLMGVSALAYWGMVVEPGRLVVRHVRVEPPGWPEAWNGLRIAALADIHAGSPHVDAAKLGELVDVVNSEQPDLVVLLGDYVIRGVLGGHFIPPEVTAEKLAGLKARLGVVAVLGNHDWWYDGNRVSRALNTAGIRVLENSAVRFEAQGQGLWIAGLADPWTRTPQIDRTLERIPQGEAVIMLSHNPDVFPDIPTRVGLTLAGHTHGGQVVLPVLGRLVVPSRFGQRYAAGLIEEDGHDLFVSSGIGTSILPVRIGAPPEVSVLTAVTGRSSDPSTPGGRTLAGMGLR